jgi:hypothetical protein
MSIDDSCMFDSIIYDTIHMEFHPRTGLSIYSNLFLPHILSSETFSRDFVHGHISTLISNLIINDVICFASNSSVIYFSTYKWDVYGECRSFNSSTKVYIHYQSLWRRSHKYIGYGWIHAGWDNYQISLFAWYDSFYTPGFVSLIPLFIAGRWGTQTTMFFTRHTQWLISVL